MLYLMVMVVLYKFYIKNRLFNQFERSGWVCCAKLSIADNATEKVLPDKWQCEYGLCQRANTMAVALTNATAMQKRADSKSVEKVVNFTLNVNVFL